MPLVAESSYQPPFYLFNGHLQTIIPSLWRTVPDVAYERERLELPDASPPAGTPMAWPSCRMVWRAMPRGPTFGAWCVPSTAPASTR